MNDKNFLGTGMKFPPQIDHGTGKFVLSSAQENIKESVYIILTTNRGERWLEPNFGSNLMSYTFIDTSLTMISLMSNDIRTTLLEQEPRISDVEVDINSEVKNGCMIIDIQYKIIDTNVRDNLVFPFYLNASYEEDFDE